MILRTQVLTSGAATCVRSCTLTILALQYCIVPFYRVTFTHHPTSCSFCYCGIQTSSAYCPTLEGACDDYWDTYLPTHSPSKSLLHVSTSSDHIFGAISERRTVTTCKVRLAILEELGSVADHVAQLAAVQPDSPAK